MPEESFQGVGLLRANKEAGYAFLDAKMRYTFTLAIVWVCQGVCGESESYREVHYDDEGDANNLKTALTNLEEDCRQVVISTVGLFQLGIGTPRNWLQRA